MNGFGNRAALRVPGAFSWTINAQDGQVKCRFKCPLPAQKQIDKSLRPSRQHANGWRCGRSATSLLSRKTRCRAKTPPRQRAKRTREDATGRGAGQATGRLMAEASRSATERRAHRPPLHSAAWRTSDIATGTSERWMCTVHLIRSRTRKSPSSADDSALEVSRLAESQAADSTVMALAGHVSRAMMERYSHFRMEAKRHAVDNLSGTDFEPGVAQNWAQFPVSDKSEEANFIENKW